MTAARKAAIAAALLVAVGLAAGCSSTDTAAPSPTTTTAGAPAQQWTPGAAPSATQNRPPATTPAQVPDTLAGVDDSDPVAVADAVVTTWFTWNTTVDAGPNDAAARTGSALTDRFREQLLATTPTGSPGGQWLEWAAVDAQVWPTVSNVPNQGAIDTASAVHRTYQVEQTAIAADGSVAGVDTVQVAVLVTGDDGRWKVDAVQQL